MAAIADSTTMQRFPIIGRVNLLGITLAGILLASLPAASLAGLLACPLLDARIAEQASIFLERSGLAATIERSGLATTIERSGSAATIEEWWKAGQANFWRTFHPLPPPSDDSLALDRLISWRANPTVLSNYEISDLSHFLLQKSRQYQVSPVLVLSLIDVESSYRKSIVSHRGAVGMMQLMPETAQQMARLSGMEWKGPSILQDPKSNIEFGLRYLVFLKERFSDPEHILTAYNIGPYALRKKLRSGEELPREYVERVMGTVKAYQRKARSDRARPALWVKSWL